MESFRAKQLMYKKYKFEQVKHNRMIISLPKTGEEWDRAIEHLSIPELRLEHNDDKQVATSLEKAKKEYISLNLFFTTMKQSITHVAIAHNSSGWKIHITYKDSKVITISSTILEKRPLKEYYVIRNKVMKEYLDNSLLINKIEELMKQVKDEIHENPYCIIYYKDKTIQLMDQEDGRLELYPLKRLKYMEGLLRSKGYNTKHK